jgi:dynein light intermediate chain 2
MTQTATTATRRQKSIHANPTTTTTNESNSESNLWNIITDQRVETVAREATLIFLGSRTSGKSSLMCSYLYRDRVEEQPRPTDSLDYRYTRTSLKDAMNEEKSLSHFWEIGGGRSLLSLLGIPLNANTVLDSTAVIVLDAQRLSTLIDDAQFYVDTLRSHFNQIYSNLTKPVLKQQLAAVAEKSNTETVKDCKGMPVQTILVLNKIDALSSLNNEQRFVIARTLRWFAAKNGCSLYYTSAATTSAISYGDISGTALRETTLRTLRSRISHFLMGSDKRLTMLQTDHANPLIIPAGVDTFQSIGAPPKAGTASWASWYKLYTATFPSTEGKEVDKEDYPKFDLSAEPLVDNILGQMNEELQRVQREVETNIKVALSGI